SLGSGDGPQVLFWDFRLLPAGGSEDVVGFGGSGAYFAALEIRAGARVGRSIALSSSQTCRHINTRGLLNQGEVMSKTHLVSFGIATKPLHWRCVAPGCYFSF